MDFELEERASTPKWVAKCKSLNKVTILKWAIFILVFLAIVILVGYALRVGWVAILLQWIASLGYWGNAMFIPLFCFISLPYVLGGYSVLALTCGFLYGPILGFITLSISSVLGCMFGYWMTRLFGQKCLGENFAEKNPFLKVVLAALQDHSLKVMVLCRLTPIPYGVQNAIFAIAKVNFIKYVLAEFILYIPTQLALAYVGSTAKRLSEVVSRHRPLTKPEIGLLVGEIVAVCFFIVLMSFLGKKAHARIKAEGEKKLAALASEEEYPNGSTKEFEHMVTLESDDLSLESDLSTTTQPN